MKSHFSEDSADDLVRVVLDQLLAEGVRIHPRKGEALELQGVLLELRNPLARLSRTESRGKLFSGLGELCWYLAGSDSSEFISYYLRKYEKSAENGAIPWAYGPRLVGERGGPSQMSTIIDLLTGNPDSRRAVIQLFDANDLEGDPTDVPCTCTLQFMIRSGELQMIVYMRSNDVILGLTHDIFTFTMLQELIGRTLGVRLGSYRHVVGSLHLYTEAREVAVSFLQEGWQSTRNTMPPMPPGDPWEAVDSFLAAESYFRLGGDTPPDLGTLDAYWQDLAHLLEIFRHVRARDSQEIQRVKALMHSDVYQPYIDEKLRALGG